MTETPGWTRPHDAHDSGPSDLPKPIRPERNPFLQRAFRIPFRDIQPVHVGPGVLEVLSVAQAEIDAAAKALSDGTDEADVKEEEDEYPVK